MFILLEICLAKIIISCQLSTVITYFGWNHKMCRFPLINHLIIKVDCSHSVYVATGYHIKGQLKI